MNYWLLDYELLVVTDFWENHYSMSILNPKPPEQNIGHGSLDEFIKNWMRKKKGCFKVHKNVFI